MDWTQSVFEAMNGAHSDEEAVRRVLEMLRWWHTDTYGENAPDGSEPWRCRGCVVCPAIEALERVLKSAPLSPPAAPPTTPVR